MSSIEHNLFEAPLERVGKTISSSSTSSEQTPRVEVLKSHLTLRMYLSPHVTYQDTRGFKSFVNGADIVVPESNGWNYQRLAAYRAVSRREMSPLETMEFLDLSAIHDLGYFAILTHLEVLYETQKPVAFVDTVEGYRYQTIGKWVSLTDRIAHAVRAEDYYQAYFESCAQEVRQRRERQGFIRQHFLKYINETVNDYPELIEKLKSGEKLDIALHYGVLHESLFDGFLEDGYEASCQYSVGDYEYDYRSDVHRALIVGEEVPNTLIAQAFWEELVSSTLYFHLTSIWRDTVKINNYIHYVASQFSTEEITDILNRGEVNVGAEMHQKGIRIPERRRKVA